MSGQPSQKGTSIDAVFNEEEMLFGIEAKFSEYSIHFFKEIGNPERDEDLKNEYHTGLMRAAREVVETLDEGHDDIKTAFKKCLRAYQEGKLETQQPLKSIAYKVKQATLKQGARFLQQYQKTYDAKAHTIAGRTLIIPDIELYEEHTSQIETDASEKCRLMEEEDEHTRLEELIRLVQEEREELKQDLLANNEEPVAGNAFYIAQISERYLSARQAHEILSFLKEEGAPIDIERSRRALTLGSARNAGTVDPSNEYAFRVQIAKDPELGEWLDDEHNKVQRQAFEECEKRGVEFSPTYYINDRPITIPADRTIH